MLSNQAIYTSHDYAEDLASRNLVIVARPDTPIANLVSVSDVSNIPFNPVLDAPMSFEVLADIVSDCSTGPIDAPTEHDIGMGQYVQQLSRYVGQHISFAKNVIRPIVTDYTERVSQGLQSAIQSNNLINQLTIIQVDRPVTLSDDQFLSTLEVYRNNPAVVPGTFPDLIDKSEAELLALALTGDSDIDDLIRQDFSGDNHYLSMAWQMNLGTIPRVSNLVETAYIHLGAYLLAKRLVQSPEYLKNPTAYSLQQYQNILSDITRYHATILASMVPQIDSYERLKTLILGKTPSSITVYGPVYREWLKSGGSPDTMLGLIVNPDRYPEVTVPKINDRHDAIDRAYRAYEAFHQTYRVNRDFLAFKGILMNCLLDTLKDFSDEEKGYIDHTTDYQSTVTTRASEAIESLTIADMSDLNRTCLYVMAASRFYYSTGAYILSEMEAVAKISPTINPREAALVAAVNYLTDYLSDQVQLVKM